MTLPDKEKALVVQIFFTMVMQALLTLVGVIAFFMVLFRLFDAHTVFDSAKYVVVEGLLGGSIFMSYKFFFPSVESNAPKEKEKEAVAVSEPKTT
jgi:hypothetical protein